MHSRSRQLGALRELSAQGFDVLAAVLFQEDYRVLRTALIPHPAGLHGLLPSSGTASAHCQGSIKGSIGGGVLIEPC